VCLVCIVGPPTQTLRIPFTPPTGHFDRDPLQYPLLCQSLHRASKTGAGKAGQVPCARETDCWRVLIDKPHDLQFVLYVLFCLLLFLLGFLLRMFALAPLSGCAHRYLPFPPAEIFPDDTFCDIHGP
jgi:hypothetical protein